MRLFLALLLGALLAGLACSWLGSRSTARYRAQIAAALAEADSARSVALERDSALSQAVSARDLATRRADSAIARLASILGRPARVDTLTLPSDSARREVVSLADYSELRRGCSLVVTSCAEQHRADSLALARAVSARDEWRVVADSLRQSVRAFDVPHEPGRFGFGACTGLTSVFSGGRIYSGGGATLGLTIRY